MLAEAVLKRLLDLDAGDLDTEVFRRRADAFLFQRLAGRRVEIDVAGHTVATGRSDRTGHFQAQIDLDDEVIAAAEGVLPCVARLRPAAGDPPESFGAHLVQGSIHVVESAGLSVISDIDDTVKITNVADRRELLRNTLLREFAAVPGMAAVYRRWQDAGTAFHYVSASPWQLSPCLARFITAAGLPAGSMHLKLFRLQDSTPLGRLPSRKRSKPPRDRADHGRFSRPPVPAGRGFGRARPGGVCSRRPPAAGTGRGHRDSPRGVEDSATEAGRAVR